jgi:hypothetical protein
MPIAIFSFPMPLETKAVSEKPVPPDARPCCRTMLASEMAIVVRIIGKQGNNGNSMHVQDV